MKPINKIETHCTESNPYLYISKESQDSIGSILELIMSKKMDETNARIEIYQILLLNNLTSLAKIIKDDFKISKRKVYENGLRYFAGNIWTYAGRIITNEYNRKQRK